MPVDTSSDIEQGGFKGGSKRKGEEGCKHQAMLSCCRHSSLCRRCGQQLNRGSRRKGQRKGGGGGSLYVQ